MLKRAEINCHNCVFHEDCGHPRHGYCTTKQRTISYPGYDALVCDRFIPKEEKNEELQ